MAAPETRVASSWLRPAPYQRLLETIRRLPLALVADRARTQQHASGTVGHEDVPDGREEFGRRGRDLVAHTLAHERGHAGIEVDLGDPLFELTVEIRLHGGEKLLAIGKIAIDRGATDPGQLGHRRYPHRVDATLTNQLTCHLE